MIRISFNPHDLFVGAYWEWDDFSGGGVFGYELRIYLLIIPMFPIKLTIHFPGTADG